MPHFCRVKGQSFYLSQIAFTKTIVDMMPPNSPFRMPAFFLPAARKLFVLLLLSGWPLLLFAQKPVTGTVRDSTGAPLPNITVSAPKGASTTTDSLGRFRLRVSRGDKLVFSSVSHETLQLQTDDRSDYPVQLKNKVAALQDVIIIGYGTTRKEDLTGAVAKAPVESMQKAPVRSFDEAMAGRVAGVQVSSVDGQPGSAVNITIRGANSVTQENSPLYVIDGFPIENPNNNIINPQDIESLEVLKDASATAIYGARGANGVIIITTKKGKTGPPVITFNTSAGLQQNIQTMRLMNPYEFVRYQLDKDSANTAGIYLTNGKTLDSYRNVPEIDWQQQLFRTAAMQNYNLSLTGGNNYTKYYVSGNIFDQNGTIINSGYKRYQGTLSLDQTVNTQLKTGVYINYSYLKQSGISPSSVSNGSATTAALYSVWGYRNFSLGNGESIEDQLFDPGIDPNLDARINPILNQQHLLRENLGTNIIVNGYAEYSIRPNLKLRVTGSINNNTTQVNQFNDTFTVYGNKRTFVGATRGANGSVIFYKNSTWVNENTLTYSKTFNRDHQLTVLAGITETGNKSASYGSSATNLERPALGINGLNEGKPETVTAVASSWGLMSFLGRADYKFKSRYLLTLSFRTDGSSKFSTENRWGYFPSGAFAWRFKQEKFLQGFRALSDGKLRVTYGVTGNNRIADFAYLSAISISNQPQAYTYGNVTIPGAYVSNFGNTALKWETTSQLDIGADLGFFNDRINLTADVYRKKTKDLLIYANLPLSLGYSNALRNIGSVQNQGLELTLSTVNIKNKYFSWRSSFNISFNQSKLLALTESQSSLLSYTPFDYYFRSIPTYIAKVGSPLGMMYGYVWDGVYQYSDFNKTGTGTYVLKENIPTNGRLRAEIQPGDIKFKDQNGDLVVDPNDYAVIGRGLPVHTGGFSNDFSYKNFDLNLFFQWSYGNDIINANRYIFEGNIFGRSNLNQFASYQNRWTPDNPSTTLFRAGFGGAGPTTPTGANSRVIEDGSYLRLKTVSLGYNIPAKTLQRWKLKALRVYASAQNVLTWTKYTGIDPEVSVFNSVLTPGFDYSPYPRPRVITLGASVSF
jgi:TonB-linked SusC/RagA family outer membrane protein